MPRLAAGRSHVCAVLGDGSVRCFGENGLGQLGLGHTNDLGDEAGEMASLPAVNLGAGHTATAITAGSDHSCALLDDRCAARTRVLDCPAVSSQLA